jgi:hypothetical protein
MRRHQFNWIVARELIYADFYRPRDRSLGHQRVRMRAGERLRLREAAAAIAAHSFPICRAGEIGDEASRRAIESTLARLSSDRGAAERSARDRERRSAISWTLETSATGHALDVATKVGGRSLDSRRFAAIETRSSGCG